MRYNKILPYEIAEIIRKIGADLSEGQEGEGGLPFLEEIEAALERAGITSRNFGVHYPDITSDLKNEMTIVFLYDLILKRFEKIGIRLDIPRCTLENIMTIEEHLDNLSRMSRFLSSQNILKRLQSDYRKMGEQIRELVWEITPIDIQIKIRRLFGDGVPEWLTTPNPLMNNESPGELIAEGKFDKIKQLLNDVETGLPL